MALWQTIFGSIYVFRMKKFTSFLLWISIYILCKYFILQKLTNNLERTTLYWEFVKSLEPPQVVHVRHGELLVADNAFAQVTVRFFTKQVINTKIVKIFYLGTFTDFHPFLQSQNNLLWIVIQRACIIFYVLLSSHFDSDFSRLWSIWSSDPWPSPCC